MKKIVKVPLILVLLVVGLFVGLYIWKVANEETLVDYDYTETYTAANFPDTENVSITYDLCFQNGTFIVVDTPDFLVQIHCKLTVLIPGAKAANPRVSITNSSYNEHLTILITRENELAPCSLEPGSAEMICEVLINRSLCIDLDASSGWGNLNLTGENAQFDTIHMYHGVNCPGNTFVDISDSVVFVDFIVSVSAGTYDITLDYVTIVGTYSVTPSDKGTIVITP
jgi:hypothetical protein